MKIIRTKKNELPEQYETHVEIENDDRVITKWFFYNLTMQERSPLTGELIIPEGIEEIESEAFNHIGIEYSLYHFPKSLKTLGIKVLPAYAKTKIIYGGSSEQFKELAKIQEESVYESDGFDRYPYYSGNSRWVTYYNGFDGMAISAEVYCKEDGVTLLYGSLYRKGNEEPKVKEAE